MFRVIEGDVTLVDNEGNVLAVFENSDSGEKVLKVRIDDGDGGENPPHVASMAIERDSPLDTHRYKHLVVTGDRNDELLVNNIQVKEVMQDLLIITKKIYVLCTMIVGDEVKEDDIKI